MNCNEVTLRELVTQQQLKYFCVSVTYMGVDWHNEVCYEEYNVYVVGLYKICGVCNVY